MARPLKIALTTRLLKTRLKRSLRLLVGVGVVCASLQASAQAGPPLITNDPDTPGAGNWEINLAVSGAHSRTGWDVAAPDLDINYGLGERMQLSVHVPWNHQHAENQPWRSGSGPVELAIRWRFVDEEKAGFAMAIQPHWASSWSSAAIRQGLAPPNDELVLPIQISKHFGKAVMGVEVSRNFIRHDEDEWQTGIFWSRDCPRGIQCLAEINTVWPAQGQAETLLNFGARKGVNEHVILIGSVGRQLSGTSDRSQILFYFGVQLLR